MVFSREMSLHAEYGVEAFYQFIKSKKEITEEYTLTGFIQNTELTLDVDAFQLKSTQVKFGISIYF